MKQWLTIALVSATSAWCEAAETANQKAAKATTPCGELLFLTEATKKLTGQTAHNIGLATQLTKEQQVYALEACYTAAYSQKAKFVLLEALAARRRAKALAQAEETATKERENAQTIEARKAQLQALIHNAIGTPKYTGTPTYATGVSSIFSGTAETCTVEVSNTPTADLTCLNAVPNAEDIKTAAAEIMKVTSMKMQPETAFSNVNLKLTLAATASIGTAGNPLTEKSGCTSNSVGAGAIRSVANGFAIHKVEAQSTRPTASTIKIDPDDNAEGSCTKSQPKSPTPTAILKNSDVAAAICELKRLQRISMKSTYTETIKNLAEDSDAQEIAEMLQTGEIKAEKSGEKKKQMVQNILGTSDKTIYEELIKPLEKIKPTYKVSGTANTNDLQTLGESDSYANGLAFCTSEAVRAAATSQSKPPTAPDSTKPEDCKEKTDKNQCNNKPGCKYNDKESKCEEDPAKTTTTTPNTNTTGSNSFVINKAPVLLSLLLF
uniref:Variant surface glycoprotein 1125.297 n=1 Tax=Trypanosoma brucei TaxID=5691 RepID=A0A1J0R5N2_9TRYP|nr:variant surface glycoprotein 1125.297 [Trypanosoma brucei]